MIATREHDPHGLCCMDCNRPIPWGTEYRERLVSLGKLGAEDCATVEAICVECDDAETAP